ncbi:MAG: type II-A CRISPR-associated protein Csn2 [Coriobacteriaceae bacterium]|nr:type II-A CRISPR-associated protein Csn2 [Coriobacteriaceae bacterium]
MPAGAMRFVFNCVETAIDVEAGVPRVLEVENRRLYCRVCRAMARLGEDGERDYVNVWDGDERAPAERSPLVVGNPLALPWEEKRLGGRLPAVMESFLLEDEELRQEIEVAGARLRRVIDRASFQIEGEYRFDLEWDLPRFLKAYAFSVDRSEHGAYIESLISFLDFASDMGFKGVLVFMGLKNFLGENELNEVYERIFFHDLKVLLLEREHDLRSFEREVKTYVNLQLLEE